MVHFEGACHCGAVTYSVVAEPVAIVNCHCNLCRKLSGGAFNTYVVVRREDLRVMDKGQLCDYKATVNATKHFCRNCGTPVMNTNPISYPGVCMLYLGTLAEAWRMRPQANAFGDDKLPWLDELTSIQEFRQSPV